MTYSPEVAAEICERLSKPESLRSICSDPKMPDRSTVARWMAQDKIFAAMIAHARELQADALADEMLAIADDAEGDVSSDGKVVWENVQRARLRCDARRWYAAKLAPKRYGEKTLTELTGEDGGPVQIDRPLVPTEVCKALSALLDEDERELGLSSPAGTSGPARLTARRATPGPSWKTRPRGLQRLSGIPNRATRVC